MKHSCSTILFYHPSTYSVGEMDEIVDEPQYLSTYAFPRRHHHIDRRDDGYRSCLFSGVHTLTQDIIATSSCAFSARKPTCVTCVMTPRPHSMSRSRDSELSTFSARSLTCPHA